MREAVGGSMLFYIILIFIFIYIMFIGLIMNYAATYRASNYVITMLERTEGEAAVSQSSGRPDDTTYDLCKSLKERKYGNKVRLECNQLGANDDAVYKVTTYVTFTLPLIGVDLDLAINNETKALYGVECTITPGEENAIYKCQG